MIYCICYVWNIFLYSTLYSLHNFSVPRHVRDALFTIYTHIHQLILNTTFTTNSSLLNSIPDYHLTFHTLSYPFLPFASLGLHNYIRILCYYYFDYYKHSYHYSYQYCLVTKHLLYYIEYIVLEIHTYPYLSHLTMFVSLHRCLHSRSLRFRPGILIRLCCHLLKSLLTLPNQHGLTRDTCQIRPILPTHAIFLYLQTWSSYNYSLFICFHSLFCVLLHVNTMIDKRIFSIITFTYYITFLYYVTLHYHDIYYYILYNNIIYIILIMIVLYIMTYLWNIHVILYIS